jgi:LysR family transcriptional regulator, cell division regulator
VSFCDICVLYSRYVPTLRREHARLFEDEMNASDLRIFEAVARLGGISRAAVELHTVQSNVTSRIRQLENGLGTQLFERMSRGMALTPAGRRLLPYARKVRDLLEDARRVVSDDGTPRGLLTIGSLETTTALRLSSVVAGYVAAFPSVELAIRTGTTGELVAAVLDRRLEGAFVSGPSTHPDLAAEAIFREELAVLAAPSVTRWDTVLSDSNAKIVVLRASCSYRQRLEDILARRGVVGARLLEFGTLEAIIACVSAGLGITLLPRDRIGNIWQTGRVSVHTLPAHDAMVDTVFIRRRDGLTSSALTAFLDRTRSVANLAVAAE